MKPEDALDTINKILFPLPTKAKEGVMLDGNAYENLDGARLDLERMGADPVSIRTIERVQKQLAEVLDVLRKAGLK